MTEYRTSETMPEIVSGSGEIGVTGSSSSLVLPMIDGTNHLLGYKMMGPVHYQTSETSRTGTGRFYTYCHPNSNKYIALVRLDTVTAGAASFSLTVGTGGATTINPQADGDYQVIATRGPVDAENDIEIVYVATSCNVVSISIWGLWRPFMDPFGGDYSVDRIDDTYKRAGSDEGQYIVFSAVSENIDRLALEIKHARQFTIRQAVSLSGMGNEWSCTPGASGTWASPFSTFEFWHRARKLRSTDTQRDYRVYARTYFTGNPGAGDTYEWRCTTTSGGSSTVAGLVRVAAGWDNDGTDYLEIGCNADDDITFEMRYIAAAGTPTLYVGELSIFELKVT